MDHVWGCLDEEGWLEVWSMCKKGAGMLMGSDEANGSWTGIQPMKGSCIGAAGMTSASDPATRNVFGFAESYFFSAE